VTATDAEVLNFQNADNKPFERMEKNYRIIIVNFNVNSNRITAPGKRLRLVH
jgi:hypothetical protein